MKNSILLAVCIGLCSIVLSGCRDIQYLTNKKMINGIGLDAAKDGQLVGTVKAVILESKGGGQFEVKDEMIQATGDSVFNVSSIIDSMLPGTIEASKAHVLIIGEELAKRGILSLLEAFYRNSKGYLTSNVLISKGLASEVLSFKNIEKSPAAFSIKQMIKGAEAKTNVPEQNLFTLWSQVTDQGVDTVLPMIQKTKNKALVVDSIGLFDDNHFSGVSLSHDESTILLLLMDKLNKQAFLDIPMKQNSEGSKAGKPAASMITFEARNEKRSLEVTVDKRTQQIECAIKVDLYGAVSSYPTDTGREIDRERLNKEMAATLNDLAADVASKLLKANCDALGIGRKLRVNHSGLWKTIDWKNEYKNVRIKPSIQVHITNTGVIN